MQVESIIRQAGQAGIELFLAGDKIAVRPKSKLSADLRELIKTNRQEVVRYLSAKSPQSRLIRLAIQSGIFDQGIQLEEKEITALVPPTDWRDVSNCDLDQLKAWAAALAMRAVRYRCKVPRGWDKVGHCAHCGPVWSEHGLDMLSCGWCHIRLAGKSFPTPNQQEINNGISRSRKPVSDDDTG